MQAIEVQKHLPLNIEEEINAIGEDKAASLVLQTKNIQKISLNGLRKQKEKLETIEKQQMTSFTQKVRSHMNQKHQEIIDLYQTKQKENKITPEGYGRYLMQAWYCSSYTPQFQLQFSEKLTAYVQSCEEPKAQQGKKFIRMVASEIEEEVGHEIWALQDLKTLGINQFNLDNDIFPQAKALIATQFDRLNRLNFIGFLGYSSYMEFLLAKHGAFQVEILSESGIVKEAQSFLYNHYVVDQGHAGENIQLFNFLIDNDNTVDEIIENLNIVHLLYHGLVNQSFS